jgi:hypothetical protein
MKKFSDIRSLSEHEGVGPYTSGPGLHPVDHAIDGTDSSVFDVVQPESIAKINAYLASLNYKPCIDPNYILGYIQRKLSIIGLYFQFPKKRPYVVKKPQVATNAYPTNTYPGTPSYTIEINPEEFPLSYMGGRIGVLNNTGTIGKDDGIYHRLGKHLKIRITYSSGGSLVYPTAQVIMVD